VLEKIQLIIPKFYKNKVYIIILFLLLSMLLEALGLGLLLPIVTIILDSEVINNYPLIVEFLSNYGIIYHHQIISLVMILFALIYLIKTILLIFISWILADYSQGLSAHLSNNLFDGYIRQPYINSINTNTAHLQRNVTTEVLQFTAFITNTLFLVSEIAICISVIAMLIYVEPFGAISVMGALIILSIIFYFFSKKYIFNLGNERLKFDQKRNFTLIQSLSAFKELKLFNKEFFFSDLFNSINFSYYNVIKKIQVIQQLPRLFFELSAVLGLSFFVVLSVYNGKDINNLIAVLSVFLLAAFRLIPSSNRILTHIQAIKYASVAVDFLYNELNKFKSNYNIKDNKKILFNLNMPIVVQNLSYSYPNTKINAINNINISIPQGSFVGIIGESGSGKSTFIDNLIGFLHPTTGNITIDGINIHKNTSGWMQNIGYVPQTIHLSDTSLRNNIAFGLKDDEIDDVKLTKALKEAELFEFVNSLSEGVFTNVGERGSKLSGGQRQRIGIARALYNDPQLLIFDEGTSALDSITEKSIINSILKFKNKKTIIMIAHRHSTLSECEMILEFNQSNMKINE
jgi:ABC-type multidrug transport system fused ATPase/permease subunit